jgi:hypothetical protein
MITTDQAQAKRRVTRRYVNRCIERGEGIYDELSRLDTGALLAVAAADDEIRAYVAAYLLCEDLEILEIGQLETLVDVCNNWYKSSVLLNSWQDRFPAFWFRLMGKSEFRYMAVMEIERPYDDGYSREIDDSRYDERKEGQR